MTRPPTSFIFAVLLSACATPSRSADGNRPNVLLIVSDDLNCDLGCYGHDLVQSPNIDRLAARGVRFEHAYCQYPVCNPSRSSFLTGLYPEQTGVLSNGGDFRQRHSELVTLPQLFQQAGYYVARVGKVYHYGVPTQIGTDGEDDAASWQEVVNPRGLDREVHDRIHTLQPGKFGGTLSWLNLDTADDQQTDGIGAVAATRLLQKHHPRETGRPFFLAVGFYRPHTPYVAPSKYFDLYDREAIEPVLEEPGDRDDIPPAALFDRPHQRELSIPQRQEIIQAYYASISYMDAQLGRLLDALDKLELTDDTIVLFTSDHGYHLGAHGMWQKSDLFEGSCRVPLVVSVPGMRTAGESTAALTEMVDIYPTLAGLCGLTPPDHIMGASLQPVLDNPALPHRDFAFTVTQIRNKVPGRKKGALGHTIRTAQHRYTEWQDGELGVELYDYAADPDEYVNLASVPGHEGLLTELRAELRAQRNRLD